MNHEEYVDTKRMKIGAVARGMLDGSVHYLEGAIELASLRHDVGAYENDPDFIAFVAVLSRVDGLPIGESRQQWSKESLVHFEPEIQKAIEWAKEFSLSQCKALAERYSV